LASPDPESDFERVFLPENAEGPQDERWFHRLGCRRWVTVTRDTASNEVR
jgi:sarcosine oxidase subunit delta